MRPLVSCVAAALVISTAAACNASDAPPRASATCSQDFVPLTGRVIDSARLLPAAKIQSLTATLAALEAKTQHQMVVATVPELQGKTIEHYSLCLANHWRLGRASADDGVLMLVAPKERKVRIEVGSGLEPMLTDEEAKAILNNAILPSFKKGDFPKGISAGVDAIIVEVSG